MMHWIHAGEIMADKIRWMIFRLITEPIEWASRLKRKISAVIQ